MFIAFLMAVSHAASIICESGSAALMMGLIAHWQERSLSFLSKNLRTRRFASDF